ncbi:MAG: hypothetical protein AAGB05_06365 [Pseudomonadota bacterium]
MGLWLVLPAVAQALPATARERAEVFAGCAGSYAAEAEHQRLTDGSAYGQMMGRAELFTLLLDATLTDGLREGAPAIALRIVQGNARARQRLLLTAAHYGIRASQSEIARHAATRRLALCETLVLGN